MIYSFSHCFNKYFSNTYYVPGLALEIWWWLYRRGLCPHGISSLLGVEGRRRKWILMDHIDEGVNCARIIMTKIMLHGSSDRGIVTTSIKFNALWSISHLCWEAQRHFWRTHLSYHSVFFSSINPIYWLIGYHLLVPATGNQPPNSCLPGAYTSGQNGLINWQNYKTSHSILWPLIMCFK